MHPRLEAQGSGEQEPIRVMIVDDHDMVRRGLGVILRVQPSIEVVGEATNGREAIELAEEIRPDVILMDLVMPIMDGVTATHLIREHLPETQIIALTSFADKEQIQGVLDAGAIGYLLKSVSSDELAHAVRQAHAGHSTLAPEIAEVLGRTDKLEKLARALLDAPVDASSLPDLLRIHVPGMFPNSSLEIRSFPQQILLRHPANWPPPAHQFWDWLVKTPAAQCYMPGTRLPWGGSLPPDEGLVVAPIMGFGDTEPLGGIYLARHREAGRVAELVPVVKSIAAQIHSMLQNASLHAQASAHQKVARELAIAGQIQASFLPGAPPQVEGWEIAAHLEPARETSGDFYDLVPLPDGHIGIVVADVADKGLGAALYMALCRTLIRTYALEYPAHPELVLHHVNERILSDAHAGLFVTLFYGVLNPRSGLMTFCNAGHHPPYLLSAPDPDRALTLSRTGMALGVIEHAAWEPRALQLLPGDVLLLYTDGVLESQNQQGEMYGKTRLVRSLQAAVSAARWCSLATEEVQNAVVSDVRAFSYGAPQADDRTLVILART